jgi:SAM-dependent methyltransferase
MVFLENPPDYASLAEIHAWEKTYEAEKLRRRQEEPVFSAIAATVLSLRRRMQKTEKIIRLAASSIVRMRPADTDVVRVLDVGCGDAAKSVALCAWLRHRHRLAVRPLGIEISSGLAQVAATALEALGGRCIHNDALGGMAEIGDGTIDLVLLCSYLEHETNPLDVLRACRRVLRPQGRIVIKVPNFACLNRHLRQNRWCGFRYPDHVNYFTPATLRAMVVRAGLAACRMSWLDTFPTSDNMYLVAGLPPSGQLPQDQA